LTKLTWDDVPAYVINLPHRSDRLESFRRDSSLFFSGRNTVEAVEALHPGSFHDQRVEPRACIGMSFQKAFRLALERGQRHALVMEDDCYFPSPKAREYADSLLERAWAHQGDWDILSGAVYTSAGLDASGVSGWLRTKEFSSTHFCLWTDMAMRAVLEHDFKSSVFHVDRLCARPTEHGGLGLRAWVAEEFFALQRSGYSDNVGKEANYEKLLSRFKLLKY